MRKTFIIASVVIVVVIILFEFLPGNHPPVSANYADSIKHVRIEKDNFMKKDNESPFVAKNEVFKGLKYFNVDESFRVKAGVVPFPGQEVVRIALSDGSTDAYIKYAAINFYLEGKPQHLIIFKSQDYTGPGEYFLPFYDESSTITTYGGGRYLDLDYKGGPEVILDFNLAYNPYCAYVEGYACPLPPAENRITVAVNAGEKKYKD